jgi:hypothetical protein
MPDMPRREKQRPNVFNPALADRRLQSPHFSGDFLLVECPIRVVDEDL